MFKTFAAALLAASVIASPVLAQGTASKPATPSTEMTKAPDNKAAVKTVKGKSHKAMNTKHRKHIKTATAKTHVKVARHGKNHVKHIAAKPAPAVTTTGSAPKAN
jgi:hypothetical protein